MSLPWSNKKQLGLSAISLACLLVGGCSTFNPYRHFEVVPSATATTPISESEAVRQLGFGEDTRLAGGAYEALSKVEEMRAALYGDLKGIAVTRSTVGMIGVLASGWGVYNALKPVSATPTPDGYNASDRLRAGRLAAVAGTSYALGQFFINPGQESIYADGYNALTCLMLQARPLLMAQGGGGKASYDLLVADTDKLSTQINKLSKRVASTQAAVDQAVDAGASKTVLERDLRNSRRALQLARDVLSDAGTLRKLIDQSGYSIGVRAAIIVGAVNAELRAQGKQIEDIKTTLDNAKSISDAFKDLAEKSTTEETDGDDASAATGTSTSSGAAVQKQPQLAGSVSSPMVFAGSAMWVSAAAAVAASGAASAAPRRPVLVVINKVPVTQIKAEIAQLKDFIVDKEAQKKHLEAMQRNAAHDKTVAELKTKLEAGEKKLAELQKKLDGAIWAQNLVGGRPIAELRRQLAIETETLFAARRPVLQALITFRAQTLAVRSATQCNSNAAGLRIFPAENRRVRAGDKLEFVASETGGAAPALLLQGNAGSSPKGSFVVVTTGTITRATLTIGCDAPSGPLLLVATDSKVRHTETIRLTVQAAGDKNKTCAAPKTEATAKE